MYIVMWNILTIKISASIYTYYYILHYFSSVGEGVDKCFSRIIKLGEREAFQCTTVYKY
jgi:hypothetical protein